MQARPNAKDLHTSALVYQPAEALGLFTAIISVFCTVVLEWELVTKFQTPFPPPQAVLSIHSRMFWAEFPSRCFWLVTRQYHKVICKNILENKEAIQGEWCESPSSPHLTWLQQGLIPVLKIKNPQASCPLNQQHLGMAQNNFSLENGSCMWRNLPLEKHFWLLAIAQLPGRAAKLHLLAELWGAVQTTGWAIIGGWHDNIPGWEIWHSTGKRK